MRSFIVLPSSSVVSKSQGKILHAVSRPEPVDSTRNLQRPPIQENCFARASYTQQQVERRTSRGTNERFSPSKTAQAALLCMSWFPAGLPIGCGLDTGFQVLRKLIEHKTITSSLDVGNTVPIYCGRKHDPFGFPIANDPEE